MIDSKENLQSISRKFNGIENNWIVEYFSKRLINGVSAYFLYASAFSAASFICVDKKSTRIAPGQVDGAMNWPVGLTHNGPASLFVKNNVNKYQIEANFVTNDFVFNFISSITYDSMTISKLDKSVGQVLG